MTIIPNALLRNGWRPAHLWGALFMMAVAVVATWDAWSDMAHMALHGRAFSHVYLVPVTALWLGWVRRGRLRFCAPGQGAIGLALIAAGWVFSSIGYQNAIESFWHGGAVLIVAGAAISVLGQDVLLSFLPAHTALLFLVPLPGVVRELVDQPLHAAMNWATSAMMILPEASRADAGDGAALAMALLLVSYAFAFSLPLRSYARLAIVMFSPISAVICGVIHAAPTAWMRGRFPAMADNVSPVAAWVALFAAVMLMLGLIRLMRWALLPVTRFTLAHD